MFRIDTEAVNVMNREQEFLNGKSFENVGCHMSEEARKLKRIQSRMKELSNTEYSKELAEKFFKFCW